MIGEQENFLGRAGESSRTLIDQLIAEQQELTAVEVFSKAHDGHRIAAERYRSLMPFSVPRPGQQYAFEVELDKCSGCKACVTACHSLNGLDDDEIWRDVGMLVSDDWRRPFQQFVTTACHHCVDPACLNGCPVLAYEKDELTGIVRHLDDQCIGCQYCVLKCPYDVPKYSTSRGIVRKCDMCSQRLASSEPAACVQACPNEAIRITIVTQADIRSAYMEASEAFLPASPDPVITLPSTRYIGRSPLPRDLIPSGSTELKLQPPHWPLIVMLIGTQLGVGIFALLTLLPVSLRSVLVPGALASASIGLGASVLHLGKPLKAWRSFLGLRRSWLSREIIAFGLFGGLSTASTLMAWIWQSNGSVMAAVTAAAGLLGVYCSAKVYDDTLRPFWRGLRSTGKFFGSTAVLALAASWAAGGLLESRLWWAPLALAVATLLKLSGEHRLLRRAEEPVAEQAWPTEGDFFSWALAQSALLMRNRLGLVTRARFSCGLLGGIVLPLLTLLPVGYELPLAIAALCLCLAGELMERYSFFRAVVPPQMPGVP